MQLPGHEFWGIQALNGAGFCPQTLRSSVPKSWGLQTPNSPGVSISQTRGSPVLKSPGLCPQIPQNCDPKFPQILAPKSRDPQSPPPGVSTPQIPQSSDPKSSGALSQNPGVSIRGSTSPNSGVSIPSPGDPHPHPGSLHPQFQGSPSPPQGASIPNSRVPPPHPGGPQPPALLTLSAPAPPPARWCGWRCPRC